MMFTDESKIFWSNLEKIKNILLLNEVEFAYTLGFQIGDYLAFKNKNKTLPMDCLFELAEKFNFHLEDLLLKSDFKLNYDPNFNMPLLERYTLAPHSQTRAIINILDYLEMTKGTRAKINLIRKFQLSEEFIKNEHNHANVFLISDILKYLVNNHNFTKSDFIGIGRRMPFLANNLILRDKLTNHKTAIDVLDCFVYECTKLFDTNCSYSINDYSGSHAVIDVLPNRNVVEELQISHSAFGNEELCLTKMGNFSSVMYFKYGKNAQIKKISSIHAGHKTNQYIMDLLPFLKMDKLLQ